MNLLMWLVFGGLLGWLASIILTTDSEQEIFANIGAGILGAISGGFLFSLLGNQAVSEFNLYSILVAVIGSAILIASKQRFFDKQNR